MKIYTRGGDTGETSLLGGTRVPKYDLRIESYGTIDELNSILGMLRDEPITHSENDFLQNIQDRLFTVGSHLATDDANSKIFRPDLYDADILELENDIDKMEATLPPLKNFVLPGGHPANSIAHLARTVCRRAERLVVHLQKEGNQVEPIILSYLNRLSDWLFVYSRFIIYRANGTETVWKPRSNKN